MTKMHEARFKFNSLIQPILKKFEGDNIFCVGGTQICHGLVLLLIYHPTLERNRHSFWQFLTISANYTPNSSI